MITKTQYKQYCNHVYKLYSGYDIFINNNKVIDVNVDLLEVVTLGTYANTRIVYKHPDSFQNKKSVMELYYTTKVLTKKENIVDTNLRNFVKYKRT